MNMIRIEGSVGIKLLDCINPIRNKWCIHWDVHEHEDGTADFMEAEFTHKPTDEEIRSTVMDWYNKQTDEAILSGFSWEGNLVWLSAENQFDYKAAYDLAVQTDGATLPVKFKFGTDDQPVYWTFDTLNDLTDFYMAVVRHIQDSLNAGWANKDNFDIEKYR